MKTAVVTGASYGIGRAIAIKLLKSGFRVYGLSRTDPNISDSNFMWLKIDLTQPDQINELKNLITEPKIDTLVNNAGTAVECPALELTNEAFHAIYDLNLVAPILVTQILSSKLENGLVVNVSSVSDRWVGEGDALYSSSKAALNLYFDAIALENPKIKVISLLPTYVDTPLQHKLSDQLSDFKWEDILKEEDIAKLTETIATDKEKFVSGQRIIVVNTALVDDAKYVEKLLVYNVDTGKFSKPQDK